MGCSATLFTSPCLLYSTGIFFNTRVGGDVVLRCLPNLGLFHCTGIIFNTRDMWGC